jgi:hypothetical protein
MRIRVVIVVVSVAVAVHALIFFALGRIAKGKGPLIPAIASKSAPGKSVPTAAAPVAPPASKGPAITPAPVPAGRSLQSRTVKRHRRSRPEPSNPVTQSTTETAPPVFDVDSGSTDTAAPDAAGK